MRLIIEPNYEQLSKWAANYVAAKIKAAIQAAEIFLATDGRKMMFA